MDVTVFPAGVHRYALVNVEASNWRNGGGLTREVASGKFDKPKQGSANDWDWRISVAEIAKNGPFSSFFGVHRTAILVNGSVQLITDACTSSLSHVGHIETFPGEAAFAAKVGTHGARLLNVMVQRERGDALASVHQNDASIVSPPGTYGCIFVAQGQFRVAFKSQAAHLSHPCDIGADEGLYWSGIEGAYDLKLLSEQGCLIHVNIRPKK